LLNSFVNISRHNQFKCLTWSRVVNADREWLRPLSLFLGLGCDDLKFVELNKVGQLII